MKIYKNTHKFDKSYYRYTNVSYPYVDDLNDVWINEYTFLSELKNWGSHWNAKTATKKERQLYFTLLKLKTL